MHAAEGLIRPASASIVGVEWARRLDAHDLPVLHSTAATLEDLRLVEETVDAHTLAEAIGSDPLMTLKVMAHVAKLRRGREGGDPETVTAALVMLGIPPFFSAFGPQSTIEERLAHCPQALDGFGSVLARSRRAAHFALAFAVHRMDHDAAVIQEAALLHDFVEMLLWVYSPSSALEIRRQLAAEPGMRSATAQMAVLGATLPDLQHELMRKWRLPSLLVDITDDHRETSSVQARNVFLAIRLARHTTDGWENPALPDDVRDVARLLNMGIDPTRALLEDIDAQQFENQVDEENRRLK